MADEDIHLCRNVDIMAHWGPWCDPPDRTGKPQDAETREVTANMDHATCIACLEACHDYGFRALQRSNLLRDRWARNEATR